jgi:hypothetical protein
LQIACGLHPGEGGGQSSFFVHGLVHLFPREGNDPQRWLTHSASEPQPSMNCFEAAAALSNDASATGVTPSHAHAV